MKNRINKFLVSLLWLLAMALGATFWFNAQYGFNFFSLSHWQYLAYMQASGQPIKVSFYISLALVIILSVFGLYILLQPHRRRIVLPIIDRSTPQRLNPSIIESERPTQSSTDDTPQQHSTEQKTTVLPGPSRPPRLNIQSMPRQNLPTVPLQSSVPAIRNNSADDDKEIRDIFESAGYVVKGTPRIKNVQTSVIAIGSDEILWIGANDVSDTDMQSAINTLKGVFTDTLEDIEIDVHAFTIGNNNDNDTNIMHFANVDELREYITAHPNPPLADDDTENFDAYSAYIGTVVDYIRKI